MVECFKLQTTQWDKRLNAAYAKALQLARGRQRDQLRASQRLWVQFRDSNCLFFDLGEGTIARIEAGSCMLRMTKLRACELESVDLASSADPACGSD
ncbi:MAG: DUF1311 domain-containing protein [Pseudolabrys sp.]|nr:DUF1311 domain-containing protein [Pseudolabrys sp.]